MILKVYEFEYSNVWPYEKDVAVRVAGPGDPIALGAADGADRMYRAYRRPGRYAEWALVEGFDRHDDDPAAFAARAGEVWIQVDYVAYASLRMADDARIAPLRERLRAGGLDAIPFPGDLRPGALSIGPFDDAFHSLRLNGDLIRDPFHVLYVSEPSDLPVINGHTIPEGADFGWVNVHVATYRRYEAVPTYRELLERLDRYSACFAGLIDEEEGG